MLQTEVTIAAMFIAFLVVVIVRDFQRRRALTPSQKAREDAEPFDDAW